MKMVFIQNSYTLIYTFYRILFKNKKAKFYQIFGLAAALTMLNLSGHSTVYYVSNSGNDSNPGTSPEVAWRTLAKVNSFKPSPGDKILFKRGDEWIGTLTIKTMGFPQKPTIYGAYGNGEKPKIYGSKIISGWQKHRGNIYKAAFGEEISQLFLDGKRMKLARDPGTGWHTITSVNSPTRFTSRDLLGSIDYTGGTVITRSSRYTMYSKKIISSNSESLTLESEPAYGLDANEGFIVCDKLDLLDEAGEWFFDRLTGTVYLWSPNDDNPANYTVRGSTFNNGIYITDNKYLQIKDLQFLQQGENGINISGGDYITIDKVDILSPDLIGVYAASGNTSNITVTNSYVFQANGGGIRCLGPNTVLLDNIIVETGLLENINKSTYPDSDNFGTGIYLRHDNSEVSYNRIINSGYCGINWKGENSIISYNYIDSACQVLDDGGGIYTYNGSDYTQPGSAGSEVKYNIVLNVHGNRNGYPINYDAGSGIYIDDRSHNVKITNNSVSACTYGIFLHRAGKISVDSNLVSNCLVGLLAGGEEQNSYFFNNMVYAFDRKGDVSWWDNEHQRVVKNDNASPVFNQNRYFHHYSPIEQFDNSLSFSEWKQETGQDKDSKFIHQPLPAGSTEKLFYNDTKEKMVLEFGNRVYKDILGNVKSGKITLKPFESIILIGKEWEIINQSPLINEQSFSITTPKKANDVIAKVLASELDKGQELFYTIEEGNESNKFKINSLTGEISVLENFDASPAESFRLIINVTDNAPNPLSSSAVVTIHFNIPNNKSNTDTIPPVISVVEIPAESNSLTVPIEQLKATDNKGVAGFFFSESEIPPKSTNLNWFSSPLPRFKFSKKGNRTLYVWGKDAAGNVSEPGEASVEINIPGSTTVLSDSTEYVELCTGEEYLGWSKDGKYSRTIEAGEDTVQQIITYLSVDPIKYGTEDISIHQGEDYLGWTESGEYEHVLTSSNGCDSIVTTYLTVSQYVSATENVDNSNITNIQIYPNPANSYIMVENLMIPESKTHIRLVNSDGEVLFKEPVHSKLHRIDLHQYPRGIYYLSFKNKHKYVIKKLIKK